MREVRLLDLKRDAALIAAYEAFHAPDAVPSLVLEAIAASGYRSMEIWRLGDRLVMVAELDPDFVVPLSDEQRNANVAWEAAMDRYQQPLSDALISDPAAKWQPAKQIFDWKI